MDFAVLPPETNSARLYTGPGPGPLLTAATTWARLAAELSGAARSYESVISHLTDEGWAGPSAAAMAEAVTPYPAWLAATAALAEQTAQRCGAAAGAFQEAFAAVVPPPVIAANRSELAALVTVNVLGQNSAAIAAVEADYAQMWGQDVAAMYRYAGRSAAAAAVTPFAQPPSTTGPEAAHSQLSRLIEAIPRALNGLGSASGVTASAAPVQAATVPSASQIASYLELIAKSIVPFNDAIKSILYGLVQFSRNLATDLDFAAAGVAAAAGNSTVSTGAVVISAPAAVSAGVADTAAVGRLTVPASWLQNAPAAKAAAVALSSADSGAAAGAGAPPAGIFADAALAGLLGRSMTGRAGRDRPGPAAAMNGHAQTRLQRLVTELAGTHEVQHWHVDPARLDSLLEELADQPGVHAVHVNPDGRNGTGPAPAPA